MQREPLPAERLRQELAAAGGFWRSLTVVAETGSTNADLAGAARAGAPEGTVLVAEHQSAGRGRAGRGWVSPPRAGLAVSVLLRPSPVPPPSWGWLPLLGGLALAEAVTELTGLPAGLKWPNDLLLGTGERAGSSDGGGNGAGKGGGVLAEVAGEAVVLGVGVNVTTSAAELPAPVAGGPPPTSLRLAGAGTPDRAGLLLALLRRIGYWYGGWRGAGGDADRCGLREAYRQRCETLGRQVRVSLPGGGELTAAAEDVDGAGRLVVRTAAGSRSLAAGDIVHLRPA